ncbi:uncharacterized protein LOC106667002 isoform X1 [Cimex lectularius]|uniref:Uncharacterized protein n=1 Tax=Cimex lectularius TaxID=79782 RepID=A0A8I6RTT8_CIMLE|nr:uncharacterized protein LOC106667002 isoform X1 [Cimex lectularius]
MSLSVSTAIAHAVLSVSSAYAISQTSDCVFAVLGFVLYFINGILGIVAYGLPVQEKGKFDFYYSKSSLYCYALCLPLFASEICLRNNSSRWSCSLLYMIPFLNLLKSELRCSILNKHTSDVIHSISFFIIVYLWEKTTYMLEYGIAFIVLTYYQYFIMSMVNLFVEYRLVEYAFVAAASNYCLVMLYK